jgi:hypothetical protein
VFDVLFEASLVQMPRAVVVGVVAREGWRRVFKLDFFCYRWIYFVLVRGKCCFV